MKTAEIEQKIKLLIMPLLLSAVVGCTQEKFASIATLVNSSSALPTPAPSPTPSPNPSPTASPTPVPCVPVADITRLTKVLFLVDTSGSNSEWVNSTGDAVCTSVNNAGCIPPTDLNKSFRLGSIRNFVNAYGSMSNLQWSFITFSNEQIIDYVSTNGSSSFTSSLNVIQGALDRFSQATDYADTPYGLAFNAATAAIATDKDHNTSANPQYYVVMLTDGFPTDLKTAESVSAKIHTLRNAAPGEVTVSTIFYGAQNMPASLAAMQLLRVIAQVGGGQFANVNNPATGIDIDTVIPGHSCSN